MLSLRATCVFENDSIMMTKYGQKESILRDFSGHNVAANSLPNNGQELAWYDDK